MNTHKIKKTLHLSAICVLQLLFCGDFLHAATVVKSLSQTTALPKEWKIIIHDNPVYASPEYDDSGWDSIDIPNSFIPYSMRKTGSAHGILWLRTAVYFDENLPRESVGLILGKIGDADQTYFNGTRIGGLGKFPPHDQVMWNQPRHYIIPDGIIRYGGKNIIAVRISFMAFDRITGTLAITNLDDWNRDRLIQNLIITFPLYILIGAGVTLGLIFMLFALKRKNRAEYITFLLQLIPGLFVILEISNAWQFPGDIVSRTRFFGFMWNALVLVHLMFLHRMYELKRKRIEVFLWIIFIFNTAVIISISDISQRKDGLIVVFTLTFLALYNISIHLQQLIRGNPYAKIMFLLGIILALGAAHDGFVFSQIFLGPRFGIFGYTFDNPVFPYASIAIFIGAGIIVVYRFLKMTSEIEDLNENLEKKVEERTQELEKSLNDLSNAIEISFMKQHLKHPKPYNAAVTPQTEEKIKEAIILINNNFKDNITREGLAAMLNVNPDHLGKAFRRYTGKKINEYINELRIKESMKQLRTTECTVIDIAFSLGFESLSTFNRSFIKILKTTPRNFRKKYSIIPHLPEE